MAVMGRDVRNVGRRAREEMPTLGLEDLTYDPRLGEDAVTAEDPPRRWEQAAAAPLAFDDVDELPEPVPTQQFRPSHYLQSSSRMVAEDAATESPPSLAPIAIALLPSTPPSSVDIWFAETPVRYLEAPGSRTTMRTRKPGLSLDAMRGTRAAAFVGSFGAVAMAIFIWGVSAIAGSGPDTSSNASANAGSSDSWAIPVMDLPVLAKAGESRAAHALR